MSVGREGRVPRTLKTVSKTIDQTNIVGTTRQLLIIQRTAEILMLQIGIRVAILGIAMAITILKTSKGKTTAGIIRTIEIAISGATTEAGATSSKIGIAIITIMAITTRVAIITLQIITTMGTTIIEATIIRIGEDTITITIDRIIVGVAITMQLIMSVIIMTRSRAPHSRNHLTAKI